MNVALKQKAIHLRRKGKTQNEIRDLLGHIPKGTLSGWLKGINLTTTQKNRITKKLIKGRALGRQLGAFTNRQKRLDRINGLNKLAEQEFKDLRKNPIFFIGLALYMAEGSRKKERFQFMNSDPRLLKIMLKWIEEIAKINRKELLIRAYIHRIYDDENCENYWSKTLIIPRSQFSKTVYKATTHKIKRNPEYKGCLRIEVKGSDLYWKVMRWGDMMSKLFSK